MLIAFCNLMKKSNCSCYGDRVSKSQDGKERYYVKSAAGINTVV